MRTFYSFIIVAALLLISQTGFGQQAVTSQRQPRAVDLGLSVKWADCNLGANSPEEYGDYYAWGETTSKTDYDWSNYKWFNAHSQTFIKYNTSSSNGAVDAKTLLAPDDDAAHVKLGGKWRMPTDAKWTELRTKCTWTWTTQGGKKGYKVTSKSNGNSIFLPAAGFLGEPYLTLIGSDGCYWSASLNMNNPNYARTLDFNSGSVERSETSRFYGLSIRPVTE